MHRLTAAVRRDGDRWWFTFTLAGDIDGIVIPPPRPPVRADNLWRTTCFEAFLLADNGPGYAELNLSPSGEWAAYAFADYRDPHRVDLLLAEAPSIAVAATRKDLTLTAELILPARPAFTRFGLSAVIETGDGDRTYWALAHPAGAPDFHHRDCFALALGAPGAA